MADDGPGAAWIEAADEESYYVLPGRADAGVILLCDHAGNAFPPGYGTLGLPPEQLRAAYRLRHRRGRGDARTSPARSAYRPS